MDRLIALIDREAEHARQGKPARIVAKSNALTEVKVIEALYRASQAGVTIDLIVRGVCCLRPGVPGVSDNIRVRSIVGASSSTTASTTFTTPAKRSAYGASADWMSRNLLRRVETAFPIEEPALRARVVTEGLTTYLADNTQAWELQTDGSYVRCAPCPPDEPRPAQETLLRLLSANRAPPRPSARSSRTCWSARTCLE